MFENRIVVLKIGTNSLLSKKGVRRRVIKNIVRDADCIIKNGYYPVIVSSGAIGFGKRIISDVLKERINKLSIEEQGQCYSMLGQNKMIEAWQKEFKALGYDVGQVLYINEMLRGDNTDKIICGLQNFISIGGIPLINENDSVTTEEIKKLYGFGDNDCLGALVSIHLKARFYINLTTVDCVYDPITNKPLKVINARERKIQANLTHWKNESNGGMLSKVISGKKAAKGGVPTIIIKYDQLSPFSDVIAGKEIGTKII